MKIYISSLILLFIFTSCSSHNDCIENYESPYTKADFIKIDQKYNIDNVQKNLNLNLKNDDTRFICVLSMGYSIPGLSRGNNEEVMEENGYKCICIDDVYTDKEDEEYSKKIYRYSAKYNLELLKKLQEIK